MGWSAVTDRDAGPVTSALVEGSRRKGGAPAAAPVVHLRPTGGEEAAVGGHATLADGALLRAAGPADAEQVAELLADRGEPADAVDLRSVVGDPDAGWDGVGVVEADGRMVATAMLLEERVRVGTVTLPAGQVELVATDRAYEHRGYVRALMGWCHERSAARGDRVQLMIGVPYFYRRFGYVYAVPMHRYAKLAAVPPVPPGVTVRPGTGTDIDAMHRLQDRVQAAVDVAMPHSAACWRWLVDRDGSVQEVAERDGEVVATARVTGVQDGEVRVGEVAGTDADGVRALLAAAAGRPGAEKVQVADRPGVPGLAALLGDRDRQDWYYARVPDWAALLEALRPELDRRLAASRFAGDSGELLLSSWSSHVRLPYAHGRLGPVRSGGPMQTPVSSGGSGVPPDALAALVLGCGAAGIEDRFPDAYLGRTREIMTVLFPPQRADLLTFYLP